MWHSCVVSVAVVFGALSVLRYRKHQRHAASAEAGHELSNGVGATTPLPQLLAALRIATPSPAMQRDAAKALAVITGSSDDNYEQFIELVGLGAVPLLCDLLLLAAQADVCSFVRATALQVLANIAGSSIPHRDVVLSSPALGIALQIMDSCRDKPMVSIGNPVVAVNELRMAVWLFSNLCEEMPSEFATECPALPSLVWLVLKSTDTEVICDACWSLWYLLTGSETLCQAWLDLELRGRLVELLAQPSSTVRHPCSLFFWFQLGLGGAQAQAQAQQGKETAVKKSPYPQNRTILRPYRTLSLSDRSIMPRRPSSHNVDQLFAPNPLHSVHSHHWLDAGTCQWIVAEAELQAQRNARAEKQQHGTEGKNGGGVRAGAHGADRKDDQNETHQSKSSCSETSPGWNRTLLLSVDEDSAGCSVYDLNVTWVPTVREWLVPELRNVVLPTLAARFGIASSRLRVCEVNVIKYVAVPGAALPLGNSSAVESSSLKLHRDGYAFSFNVLLNGPDMFGGGGTIFPSLGSSSSSSSGGPAEQDSQNASDSANHATSARVSPEQMGDVLMHSGQLFHGAGRITAGVRYILVGFVEVAGLRNLERLENIDWDWTGLDLDLRVLREHWGTMCNEGDSENESGSESRDGSNVGSDADE